MNNRYWLFQRHGVFYLQDAHTRERESLRTRNRREAERIRDARNCYDNAAMEAFWSTLKLELIYRRTFDDIAQARQAIFDYIEVFYNRQCRHSALGYRTPADVECANN